MAATTPKTIVLKGAEHCIQHEGTAGGAITPGMLVMLNSSGLIVVHNGDVAGGPPLGIALEDDAQGRGIDDAYDATTHKNVRYVSLTRGAEFYGWLADNVNAAVAANLGSNGDGTLDLGVTTSPAVLEPVYGVALEAVDTTGSPAATPVRIKFRAV